MLSPTTTRRICGLSSQSVSRAMVETMDDRSLSARARCALISRLIAPSHRGESSNNAASSKHCVSVKATAASVSIMQRNTGSLML